MALPIVPTLLSSLPICSAPELSGVLAASAMIMKLAPHEPVSQCHHNQTGEDNADAHLKRQVMGREVVVAITKGKLDFVRGNKSSMANSMGGGGNECS
jgi:hypothetical protein